MGDGTILTRLVTLDHIATHEPAFTCTSRLIVVYKGDDGVVVAIVDARLKRSLVAVAQEYVGRALGGANCVAISIVPK